MKKVRILLFALSIPLIFYSQTDLAASLKYGEKVPAFSFRATIGDSSFESSLGAYRGKIIILDFWGVSCVDCVAFLPKMLELQQQFGDKIQILVVTKDSKEMVNELWKKFEGKPLSAKWVSAGRKLPFITEDTILYKWFPYVALPTHAWIDKYGKFMTSAYSSSTYSLNIQSMLDGGKFHLDTCSVLQIDLERPLTWMNDSFALKQQVKSYAFLSKRVEFGQGRLSLPLTNIDSASGKIIEISCINRSIPELYSDAYKDIMPEFKYIIPNNRILVETNNVRRFFPKEYNEDYFRWASQNVFCYAQRMPLEKSEKFFSYMRSNLDFYFGIKSSFEKRKIKCLVFRKIRNRKFKPSKYNEEISERIGDSLVLQRVSMNDLFIELDKYMYKYHREIPFINQVNDNSVIDIVLPLDSNGKYVFVPDAHLKLKDIGIEVVEEFVNINMLILDDR